MDRNQGPSLASPRRRRSSQISPIKEESDLLQEILPCLSESFYNVGSTSASSSLSATPGPPPATITSPALRGRASGVYNIANISLDDIDSRRDSMDLSSLHNHYLVDSSADESEESEEYADSSMSERIPKRLSEAFTGELSKEFLVYLNLKADLEDEEVAFAPASSSTDYVDEEDSNSTECTIDRDRIRRTSSIMRRPDEYKKRISMVASIPRTTSASSRTTTFDAMSQHVGSTRDTPPCDQEADMQDYFKARRELRMYRKKLAQQCETNSRLEKNLRALDEYIGLLIHHRITIEDIDLKLLSYDFKLYSAKVMTEKKSHLYGQLFHFLQNQPHHLAHLARQLALSEIDDFLQTIMFTLFGNFEVREEHLLLSMFEHALALEFQHATDLGSVMRNNSAISRMMTTYTRRGLGQQYLKDVLLPQIELIYELNDLSLEIDPIKVFNQLEREGEVEGSCLDADDAMLLPKVRDIVQERARALKELCTRFLDAIMQGLESIPYGVRWLCKSICTQCQRCYPDVATDPVVSLIGGFFLLRYINPAIISPEAFGILHKKPTLVIRKNLTQIAKILQSVANNATSNKSVATSVLSSYIKQQHQRLRRFLLEICQVEDFYTEYHLEKISALGRMESVISITPNEIYSVHSLMVKYRPLLSLPPTHALSSLLSELGEPPGKLSRESNVLMELRLSSSTQPTLRQDSHSSLVGWEGAQETEKITEKQLYLIRSEKERTRSAFETACENAAFLTEKIEAYQSYLENVRGQSVSGSSMATDFVSIGAEQRPSLQSVKHRRFQKDLMPKGIGPFEFKLSRLFKENVVLWSNDVIIPESGDPLRNNYVVVFSMPTPGHVIFSVRVKGRAALFHTECKFEDILIKMEDECPAFRLGNVLELDAHKTLVLLDMAIFK